MSNYSRIRPDTIASLRAYADHGVPTGDFLRAVLSNDLREACARADDDNREAIFDIVHYCVNELPPRCWGSPEKYRYHLWRKELERNANAEKSAQA